MERLASHPSSLVVLCVDMLRCVSCAQGTPVWLCGIELKHDPTSNQDFLNYGYSFPLFANYAIPALSFSWCYNAWTVAAA